MKITIQEPWWGAWSRFNWPRPFWGIGINKKYIFDAMKSREKVYVHINKVNEDYWFDPIRVNDYVQKKKTMYLAGKNTLLYIVPKFMLHKEVKDEVNKTIKIPF